VAAGDLQRAVDALRAGDIDACGRFVDAAYRVDDPVLFEWWRSASTADSLVPVQWNESLPLRTNSFQ